jgi:hypothetical protein
MRSIIFTFSLLLLLSACDNGSKTAATPTTDLEVAQAFIRAILDNKIPEAERFLLKTEVNIQHLDAFKRSYNDLSKTELEAYKKADIIINEISTVVNDSIIVINYSNSHKPEAKNKVKLVRSEGKWLVDLQYTFSGNL